MSFNQFLPTDYIGWSCLICMLALLVVLYVMNRGVLKCKESIENYVIELRAAKQANKEMYDIITFVDDNSPLIDDYATSLNMSNVELLKKYRELINGND